MNTNKAIKSVVACYSFRGHDFQEHALQPSASGTDERRFAKKVTRRAERRLNKALAREAA